MDLRQVAGGGAGEKGILLGPPSDAKAPMRLPRGPVEGAERPGIGVRVRRQGGEAPAVAGAGGEPRVDAAGEIDPSRARLRQHPVEAGSKRRALVGCKQNGPSGSRIRSRRVVRRRVLTRSDPSAPRRPAAGQGTRRLSAGVATTKSRISAARASGRSSGSRCRRRRHLVAVAGEVGQGQRGLRLRPEIAVLRPAHHQGGVVRMPMRSRQSSLAPLASQAFQACGLARSTSSTVRACPPDQRGAPTFAATKASASRRRVSGSASIQAIIACRRSSSIGSGQGGEPASSTSPARPASAGSPSSLRERQRQGDLRPHAVAGDEPGPGRALGFDAGGDVVGHGGDAAPGWSASSPNPAGRWRRSAGGARDARRGGARCGRCLRGSAGRRGGGVVDHAGEIARCCAASTAACPRRLAAPRDDLSSHRRTRGPARITRWS